MGLHAEVHRSGRLQPNGLMKPDDFTLNGWSSRFDRVCVINAIGPFDPSDEFPGVLVVKHRTMQTLHVVSLEHFTAKRWTMFGGNILSCSDSRFGELIGRMLGPQFQYAVSHLSIHDRVE
jgi:hypothetical protein